MGRYDEVVVAVAVQIADRVRERERLVVREVGRLQTTVGATLGHGALAREARVDRVVAVHDREARTQQAYVMGSLPYLAPERYGFEDLPAGDVYSLERVPGGPHAVIMRTRLNREPDAGG